MVSEHLKQYNIPKERLEKFDIIASLLVSENEKYNLTAITEEKDIAMLHFYDSVTPVAYLDEKKSYKILDIGCGAGFPGLPLAVCLEKSRITLLDSTAKKLGFATLAAKAAGIKNISAICGRAEELGAKAEHRESYDVVVARGVAALNVLCEWCLPFVRVGGCFIAMKGRTGEDETEAALNAITTLGGELAAIQDAAIPETDRHHTLIFIDKKRKTPPSYPRSNAAIKKKPL